MKLYIKTFLSIMAAFFLLSCVSSNQSHQTRVDEIPIYGGMDRSSIPGVKSADDKFINDVSVSGETLPIQFKETIKNNL